VAARREAFEEGAATADDLARWTRCGLGECRWRRCGGTVLRWLSGVLATPVGRLAPPQLHLPIRPVPLSALAAAPVEAPPGVAAEDTHG